MGGRALHGRRLGPWLAGSGGLLLAAAVAAFHVVNRSVPDYGLTQFSWVQALECVTLAVLGAVILRRHARHPIGLLLVGLGLGTGVSALAREWVVLGAREPPGLLPGAGWALWLGDWLWLPAYLSLATILVVLFPNGRSPARGWGPVVVGAVVSFVVVDTAWMALTPFPTELPPEFGALTHPLGITGEPRELEDVLGWWPLAWVAANLVALGAFGVRLARTDRQGRRPLLWFALGAGVWSAWVLVDGVADLSARWLFLEAVFILAIPTAATVGIVWYGLLDVERVINRTAMITAFAVGAGCVYAFVIVLGQWAMGGTPFGVQVMAAVTVACVAFPLWQTVQRLVGRLLFGERDDPYRTLIRLVDQLAALGDPAAIPRVVSESLVDSLHLPYAAVETETATATAGRGARGVPLIVPIENGRERLGRLIAAPRSEGESFSDEEQRLIRSLAAQVGAALHAAQLTDELQRSRQALVRAREDERRRIRRDLHDGLGPQLAGVGLQIDLASLAAGEDADATLEALSRAKRELRTAVDDVRRLVYDLRPPALDEVGLVGAIQQRLELLHRGDGVDFRLDAPHSLGPLPAAVEVAAYRIVTEAATNVVRHAGAKHCDVRLMPGDELAIEVADDGHGLPAQLSPGVGFTSLRERAQELGGRWAVETRPTGGTVVSAWLPISP